MEDFTNALVKAIEEVLADMGDEAMELSWFCNLDSGGSIEIPEWVSNSNDFIAWIKNDV